MSLLTFLLKTSRGVVALAVVSAAVSGAGGVALIGMVHAALSGEGPVSPRLGWAFAGLCVVVAATRVITQSAMARIGQGAVMALCTRVCRSILALPLERFEAIDKGSLVAVLTEDVVIVANALAGVPQVCLNVPLLALCFAYAGWLSPVILVSGVLFATIAVGSYLALVSPAMGQLVAARAMQDGLVGHFRTLIDGFRELRQHRGRRLAFLTLGLEPAAASVRDRAVAGQTLFALAEGWGELGFFGFLGFLVFALPNLLTLDRAALAGAVLVVVYVMGPLDVLLTWVPILARARTSLGRINALIPDLDAAAEDNPAPAPRPLRESVCLEGVTFDYPGEAGDRGFALGPVDLTLRPGEVVILAGGNGSGKTTLLKVLTGLYTPKTGAVRLDGRLVVPDTLEDYRQLFSVLFADGHLFRHLYGLERPGIEDEASRWLDRMELTGRVHVDGDTYSTTDLSQGQRGRLALLTACLEGRPVCVFDEWAANQDPNFKRAYYREILPGLRASGKALLVISHDEDYYDVADRVVRLRDGRIVDGDGAGRRASPAAVGVTVDGAAALASVPAVGTGERS
jgi:putative ATP-binding cassette transporter